MTTERNIIIYAGQTFTLSLDYAGTVGRGQRMHIRASDAAADVIAILSHNGDANARVIYDGTDSLDITIGASVNGGWLVGANRVEWVYDIEDYDLSDTDDVVIAYRGKAIVYGNRTRPEDVTPSAALPSGDGRYVRFDGVQWLTDAQKLQARENIGAGTGGSGSGDVVGPASATDDRIAAFDGTTGKLIKQGAVTATAVASHLSSTSNPHSVTAAQVGADPAGTAASAVSTHNSVTTGAHGMTAFGASLVDDADASAARTTLGLGTAATAATGDFATASHTHAASDVTSGTFDAARLPAASETAQGAVELATTAEALTGTDAARAVTPAGVKAVADTKAASSHTHAASDITSGTLATARLGSGTANSTTFLRGDQTWATPSATPGGSSGQIPYNNAGTADGSPLWRDDANTVTQRNSTNAQSARWANTWTDGSNYELGSAQWVSNVFTIGTIKAGTGVARGLALQVDGTNVVSWNASTLQATFAFQTNHSSNMNFSGLGRIYGHRNLVNALTNTSYTFTTADCGGTILIATNASDQNLTTPASPGSGTHIGFKVSTSKSSYLRITANTGQKIRLAGGLSASAGYVRSNVAGSFVWLIYDSTDAEWVAWQQGGTWTIDS